MTKEWVTPDNKIDSKKLAEAIYKIKPVVFSTKTQSWYDEKNLKAIEENTIIKGFEDELRSYDERLNSHNSKLKGIIDESLHILKTSHPVESDTILPFSYITGQQLNDLPYIPVEFIVEGLLPADGISMLVGRQKIGKSWLAFQLALAICKGESFLNRKTKKGTVLYLDLEGSIARTKARLNGEKAPSNLLISQNRDGTVNTLSNGFIEQLDYTLNYNPDLKLIIIDHWALLADKKRGYHNDYEAGQANTEGIRKWAHEKQIAVLLLYHQKKASGSQKDEDIFGTYVGGASIFGAAEAQWILTEKNDIYTLSARGRDFVDGDIYLRLCRSNSGFTYGGTEEEAQKREKDQKNKESPLFRCILDHLKDNDIWITTATELSDCVFSLNGETLSTNRGISKELNMVSKSLSNWGITYEHKSNGKKRVYIFKRNNKNWLDGLLENK